MTSLLYLKSSLLRRPKQHLSLFIILTCAFILPLLISIYRDSSAYGTKQRLLDWTKGETFKMLNASEADLEVFEGINGLSSPRYENGIIYLHILSDEEWKNHESVDSYGNKIMKRMEDNDAAHLIVTANDYYSAHGIPTVSSSTEQSTLLILNFLIILLSSFIIGSAYKSHIKRFSSDMGVLRSLGAENRQIYTIFIAEFVVIFVLSAVSAVLISAGVMKLLFVSYLEIRDIEGLEWLIFKMSPINTALHIAIFFVVLLFIIMGTLIRSSKESTVSMVRGDIQSSEMRQKSRKLKIKASPDKSLLSLWLQRTNKAHRSCLWVSIPVMTVFLFLFSYLSLDIDFISGAPEYEIRLLKDVFYSGGFTQDDIDYIQGISQIGNINCRCDTPIEIFDQDTGGLFIDAIDIKLTSPELHKETENLLKQHFSGKEYKVHNYQATAEYGKELSMGVYLMLMFIFSAMFVFILIIVYMKLSDYIGDSRKTIKSLSIIGASNRTITSSYIRQSAISAVFAAVLSTITSIVLFTLAAASTTQKPAVDVPFILVYSIVSVLTVCTFILPVYHSLKLILERRKRSET